MIIIKFDEIWIDKAFELIWAESFDSITANQFVNELCQEMSRCEHGKKRACNLVGTLIHQSSVKSEDSLLQLLKLLHHRIPELIIESPKLSSDCDSLIGLAVLKNLFNVADFLMKCGLSVDVRSGTGRTALHAVAFRGRSASENAGQLKAQLEYLLSKGADATLPLDKWRKETAVDIVTSDDVKKMNPWMEKLLRNYLQSLQPQSETYLTTALTSTQFSSSHFPLMSGLAQRNARNYHQVSGSDEENSASSASSQASSTNSGNTLTQPSDLFQKEKKSETCLIL